MKKLYLILLLTINTTFLTSAMETVIQTCLDNLLILEIQENKVSLQRIRILIKQGANIDAINNYGQTPLHTASWKGFIKAIELFITNNANIDAINNHGQTPLHTAACKGHTKAIELLIKNNASVNIKNNHGQTPLHTAACKDHAKTIELLIKKEALIDAINDYGQTPLHTAALKNKINAVEALLIAPIAFQSSKLKKSKKPINQKGEQQAETLQKLTANFLIENAPKCENNDKKATLNKTFWFEASGMHKFDNITIAYGKDKKIYNGFSKKDKKQFMQIVMKKHLAYIKKIILLKDKEQRTAIDLAEQNIALYLREIKDAKTYRDLKKNLRDKIIKNYKNQVFLEDRIF